MLLHCHRSFSSKTSAAAYTFTTGTVASDDGRATPGMRAQAVEVMMLRPRTAGVTGSCSALAALALALALALSVLVLTSGYASELAPPPVQVPLLNSPQIKSRLLVTAQLPFGTEYRPGYGFPLKLLITNTGSPVTADVLITQGEGDSGIRIPVLSEHAITAGTAQSPLVCVRVPDIDADLNVLVREPGSAGTVLFKGSLRPVLRGLPDETRVVLCCGANADEGLPREFNHTIHVDAKDLPNRAWMYESVDLVILSDGTFNAATAEAKEALRNWLLSGGRLLLTSSGPSSALQAALTARLLPIHAQSVRSIPTDFKWWEENMGLSAADILKRRANQQPVYVKTQLGFGHVVFLFPGNGDAEARAFGVAVLNDPWLEHRHDKYPDLRVQNRAYDATVRGMMGAARMRTAGTWFGIGALIFCGLLVACSLIRSRLEAIGWVVCLAAVVTVMLNNFFPEPQRVVSRVQWSQIPADGRALVRKEWSLVEAFRRNQSVSATGPAGGSLIPLFPDKDRLSEAQFGSAESDERQQLYELRVAVDSPALLLGVDSDERSEEPGTAGVATIKSRDDGTTLNYARPGADAQTKLAIWVDAHGRRTFIEQLDTPGGFAIAAITDEVAAIRATVGSAGGEDAVKARSAALLQAIRSAGAAQHDTLIFWSGAGAAFEPLIELSAENGEKPAEEGARFALWSVECAASSGPGNPAN